ncbi:MAG: hypothetical protein H7X92_04245, partial [Chitinophagales bacterium]|nr:hypothetical protein [Hyphomicrobiales bacterium]
MKNSLDMHTPDAKSATARRFQAALGKLDISHLNPSGRWTFRIGLGIVVLSLISGFATYLILNGLTPIPPTHNVVVTVLLINVVLVLALMGAVAFQLVDLWRARKRQAAGAGLHVR